MYVHSLLLLSKIHTQNSTEIVNNSVDQFSKLNTLI